MLKTIKIKPWRFERRTVKNTHIWLIHKTTLEKQIKEKQRAKKVLHPPSFADGIQPRPCWCVHIRTDPATNGSISRSLLQGFQQIWGHLCEQFFSICHPWSLLRRVAFQPCQRWPGVNDYLTVTNLGDYRLFSGNLAQNWRLGLWELPPQPVLTEIAIMCSPKFQRWDQRFPTSVRTASHPWRDCTWIGGKSTNEKNLALTQLASICLVPVRVLIFINHHHSPWAFILGLGVEYGI